jgi:hypothetical protein
MKKYILIHFEIQKKLIVVGLFLLLAGFRGPQANFTGRSLNLGLCQIKVVALYTPPYDDVPAPSPPPSQCTNDPEPCHTIPCPTY